MKLSAYLAQHDITDAKFAELVKRDRTRVLRWRKHGEIPDQEALGIIFKVTDGAVTANDFYHEGAAA